MQPLKLSVAPHLGAWAVKHGDGYLGATARQSEAVAILKLLVIEAQALGRPVEAIVPDEAKVDSADLGRS
ncbi:MAG: hypothetical protein P4L64_04690 [Caulobacteraceae bacterium]|nr:hypothetical protein [Caulobacteraceae bacterium]